MRIDHVVLASTRTREVHDTPAPSDECVSEDSPMTLAPVALRTQKGASPLAREGLEPRERRDENRRIERVRIGPESRLSQRGISD